MDSKQLQVKRKTRPLFRWTRAGVGLMLLLLVGVGFFIWLTADIGNAGLAVMDQVSKQQARIQTLAKDAAIIINRESSKAAKDEAESQLKSTYQTFRQVHEGLSKGDASLRLPSNVRSDVLKELIVAQQSYNRISEAAKLLITAIDTQAPPPEDSLRQILQYESVYSISMAQVSFLWRERIANVYSFIFWISVVPITIVCILIGVLYTLHELRVYHVPEKKEASDEEEATVPKTTESQKSKAVAQDTAESDENKT